MGEYGQLAVEATRLIATGSAKDPSTAWDKVAAARYGKASSSAEKGCPKNAFLGCCEDGLVRGVSVGSYTSSVKNKRYATTAVQLIKSNPKNSSLSEKELWHAVLRRLGLHTDTTYNHQMDVVLTLYKEGLIV